MQKSRTIPTNATLLIDAPGGMVWWTPDEHGGRPIRHAIISYTFLKPRGEPYDTDNAISLAKPLVDGLVDGGLLVGDNARQVEYHLPVRQERGDKRSVEITITEIAHAHDR